MLRKNTASQFVYFAGVNATTGAALTGATITGRRILDGTAAALGATITEPNSDGFYQAALTQADTNGNDIGYFFTATNMVPVGFTVVTTAANPTDSVRFGLTALPNAAAGAAGGLPTDSAGKTSFNDIAATAIVSSGAITTSGGAVSTVTTVTNQLTAAQIATGVWQDTTAGDFTAASSIGKSIMNGVSLGTGLTVNDITTKTGFSLLATTGLGNQTSNITGNLSGSVGSVTGAVGSVTGNVGGNVAGSVGSVTAGVTVTTNNDKTGYSLTDSPGIKKNTALANFMFLLVDSADHVTPKTGLTVTATRSLDGAAFGACANAVSEISNGVYKISLAAADLNADTVTLRFTATGADDRLITIVTET